MYGCLLEDCQPPKERHCIVNTFCNIYGTIMETLFSTKHLKREIK